MGATRILQPLVRHRAGAGVAEFRSHGGGQTLRVRTSARASRHRRSVPLLAAAVCTLLSGIAFPQERVPPIERPPAGDRHFSAEGILRTPAPEATTPGIAERTAKFLAGGAAGLGLHEAGHLAFDGVFGVQPEFKSVQFAGIPFFAITHAPGLPARQEFAISSAGFWMQHLTSEVLLTRHPGLRHERAPFRKGILAFNVLASIAYGGAAMAEAGPFERDTRGMASSLHVNEPWIGALVLVPAALDAWRYFHPEQRWAKWVSRGAKVGGVLLVLR